MIEEREGSELERWAEEGTRLEPTHSNVVTYIDPEERFRLEIHVDGLIEGYLIEFYHIESETLLARLVQDHRESAENLASEIANKAERYLPFVDDERQSGE